MLAKMGKSGKLRNVNYVILLTIRTLSVSQELLLSRHWSALQRGNLILVHLEYVLDGPPHLSNSPAIHSWVQERVDKNRC